jgi:hypothetical protein
MRPLSFAATWKRAQLRRSAPAFSLGRLIPPPALEPCPLDPTRPNAHPAQVLELALLSLDEDAFNAARPTQHDTLQADAPAKTGVAWIDEQEAARYGSERTN